MAPQEIRFAHVRSGARIAWAVTGQSSGRGSALLRAAHWMTNVEHDPRSPIWQPWLERLGRDFRCVRYDERGCGMSGPDSTALDLETAVEEIEVVADAAGLQQMALLGMSGGAAPALAYAVRHPERVSHLVLLGAYARGPLGASAPPASADQIAWLEATERLIRLGWGKPGSPVQQFFTSTLIPAGNTEQVAAMNEQQRLCCGPERAAALLHSRVRLDVSTLLPLVRCPTLVLHAEHDVAVDVESGRALAAAIPGARFQTLPTHNHLPLAGEPAFEQFCAALASFVHANPQTPAAGADFTARERALLHLVAQGRDNLQIGADLGLADKTVRNTLSRLYTRLGVEGRPQAVVRARELGFG